MSTVTLHIDGQAMTVPAGTSVAAALAQHPSGCARLSVSSQARAPFCGMGICHECRTTINGRLQLACQTLCTQGMHVTTGLPL